MCDTGGTIKLATNALIEGGARSVYAVVSHGASKASSRRWDSLISLRYRSSFGRKHRYARQAPPREDCRAFALPPSGGAQTDRSSLQVTNTICQTEHLRQSAGKLEIMDISPVLAESIRRVRSCSPAFRVPLLTQIARRRTTERVSVCCSLRVRRPSSCAASFAHPFSQAERQCLDKEEALGLGSFSRRDRHALKL